MYAAHTVATYRTMTRFSFARTSTPSVQRGPSLSRALHAPDPPRVAMHCACTRAATQTAWTLQTALTASLDGTIDGVHSPAHPLAHPPNIQNYQMEEGGMHSPAHPQLAVYSPALPQLARRLDLGSPSSEPEAALQTCPHADDHPHATFPPAWGASPGASDLPPDTPPDTSHAPPPDGASTTVWRPDVAATNEWRPDGTSTVQGTGYRATNKWRPDGTSTSGWQPEGGQDGGRGVGASSIVSPSLPYMEGGQGTSGKRTGKRVDNHILARVMPTPRVSQAIK